MPISKAKLAEREELAEQVLKSCSICKEIKEHSEFHKAKETWDGLRSRCRICQSDKDAAYREANPEKIRECRRKYYAANLEKERERQRVYREANQDKVREMHSTHHRAKRASDPLWGRLRKGAARARKLGCEVIPFNSKDLLAYWEVNSISSENCYYCNSEFNGFFHLDHKIPFSNGGHHSVENLVPACPRCNTLKQSKTAEEFAASISDVS